MLKTRLLCTRDPQHRSHTIRFLDNGSVECDCGPGAITDASRLGAAVKLGANNVLDRSCVGFIAFVTVGLPDLVAARVDATGKWGAWKDMWTYHATNAVVRDVFSDLVHKRDQAHAATLTAARRALLSCAKYRDGMTAREFGEELRLMPDTNIEVGQSVALHSGDTWKVPLQPGWMETVGKAKAVIGGKFVVGVSKHPGFVYAIDDNDSGGFEVREFALLTDRSGRQVLGQVAKP